MLEYFLMNFDWLIDWLIDCLTSSEQYINYIQDENKFNSKTDYRNREDNQGNDVFDFN
jgi:hypothetical protein